jgi:hypothetical protein
MRGRNQRSTGWQLWRSADTRDDLPTQRASEVHLNADRRSDHNRAVRSTAFASTHDAPVADLFRRCA